MGRTGTGYTAAKAVIAAGLLLATVPGAQGATLEQMGPKPCVGISIGPPPDVAVGQCNPAGVGTSSSEGAPDDVDATLEASDVTVTWAFDDSGINATGFAVYRGETPFTLTRLATTGNHTFTYTDTDALASVEAVWYSVATITEDGRLKMSSPTLVEPV